MTDVATVWLNTLGRRSFRSSIGQVSRPGAKPLHVLVYSSNARTREQVRLALGKRVHPELPDLTYTDVATGPMVIRLMDDGGFDLVILDGEAAPVGGMGIAKQLRTRSRTARRCWS